MNKKEIHILVGLVIIFGLSLVSLAHAGTLVNPTVTPGSPHGGLVSNYAVSFEVASSTEVEAQIRLIFPAGFSVSAATATSTITASSTGSAVVATSTVSGTEITIWLADGSVTAAAETIEIAGIPSILSPYAGGSFTLGIETRTQADELSDQASSTSFTILAAQQGEKTADTKPPVSSITAPTPGETIPGDKTYTISGTGKDAAGTVVKDVEISIDGGTTWFAVKVNSTGGSYNWQYDWENPVAGEYTVKVRATDGKGNAESASSGVVVTVTGDSDNTSTTDTGGDTTPTPAPSPTPAPTGTVEAIQAQIQTLQTQVISLMQQLVALLTAQL